MIPTLQSFIWYGFQPGYNDSFMFKFNQIWKNANLLYKSQWDIVIVYKQIQISKPWFHRTPYSESEGKKIQIKPFFLIFNY